jgi:hypothetical protein
MSNPLHSVILTVNKVEQTYQVAVSDSKSWEDTLHLMVILNKHGKSVYRGKTDGNRVAILVNHLYKMNKTVYVTHNGTEYIYVPTMDVLISRASKKLCWLDKNNPQRRVMVRRATSKWIKKTPPKLLAQGA